MSARPSRLVPTTAVAELVIEVRSCAGRGGGLTLLSQVRRDCLPQLPPNATGQSRGTAGASQVHPVQEREARRLEARVVRAARRSPPDPRLVEAPSDLRCSPS